MSSLSFLSQLLKIETVAETLVACLLADAYGVLALYAICEADADIKTAVVHTCPDGDEDIDAETILVHRMERTLAMARARRRILCDTRSWSMVPTSFIHHACCIQDGQFLQAIHHVLDVPSMNVIEDQTCGPMQIWIDKTSDVDTYVAIAALYRRKSIYWAERSSPQRQDDYLSNLISPAGLFELRKHSVQITCHELFRKYPDRFAGACHALANILCTTPGMTNADPAWKVRVMQEFMSSSRSQETDAVADYKTVRDECVAQVRAALAAENTS